MGDRCGACGQEGHKRPTCPKIPGREGKSRCASCKTWLPVERFSICNRQTGTLQRLCKKCLRPYKRGWYNRHRAEWVSHVTETRKDLKEWFRALKRGRPCVDCAHSYHPYVMDFDHRLGEGKEFKLSTMVNCGFSREKILKEIAKCDLVCANCHRMRTWSRFSPEQQT